MDPRSTCHRNGLCEALTERKVSSVIRTRVPQSLVRLLETVVAEAVATRRIADCEQLEFWVQLKAKLRTIDLVQTAHLLRAVQVKN